MEIVPAPLHLNVPPILKEPYTCSILGGPLILMGCGVTLNCCGNYVRTIRRGISVGHHYTTMNLVLLRLIGFSSRTGEWLVFSLFLSYLNHRMQCVLNPFWSDNDFGREGAVRYVGIERGASIQTVI